MILVASFIREPKPCFRRRNRPYLAPDLDVRDDQPPRIDAMQIARGSGGWTVSIKASDNLGLRAIVFIDREAGSIVGGRRLSGKVQTIFQMPYGCSEQTSSTTYPNVLALDYVRRTKTAAPEIEAKARKPNPATAS